MACPKNRNADSKACPKNRNADSKACPKNRNADSKACPKNRNADSKACPKNRNADSKACPYANILGVPGEGVHATRIFGLALNDILLTVLLALIVSWLSGITFWKSLVFWFVLGEVLHYAFGTQTAFLKMIGLTPTC